MSLHRAFRIKKTLATFPRDIKKLPRSIKWASLTVGIYYLSWGFLDPFLPIYFNNLLGGYSEATLVMSFLYLFSIIWSIPMGRIVDIISKKKLLSLFLFLYLPLGPVLSLLKTVPQLILFRLYHSFSASGLWTSSESYVRVHSPKHQRSEAIGLFDTGFNLALVVGAIAGGFIVTRFGIPFLFYLLPAVVSVAWFLSVKFLPDHQGTKNLREASSALHFKKFAESIKDFLQNKKLAKISALSFLLGIPVVSVGSVLLSLFSDSLGATPIQIGFVYALAAAPFLFETPFSVVADNFSRKKVIILGGVLSAVLLGSIFFVSEIKHLFVLSFLIGITFAMITPALEGVITSLMPKQTVGELDGVYRSINHTSYGLGILAVGPLADSFGIGFPFLVVSAIMIIFSIVAFRWLEDKYD